MFLTAFGEQQQSETKSLQDANTQVIGQDIDILGSNIDIILTQIARVKIEIQVQFDDLPTKRSLSNSAIFQLGEKLRTFDRKLVNLANEVLAEKIEFENYMENMFAWSFVEQHTEDEDFNEFMRRNVLKAKIKKNAMGVCFLLAFLFFVLFVTDLCAACMKYKKRVSNAATV